MMVTFIGRFVFNNNAAPPGAINYMKKLRTTALSIVLVILAIMISSCKGPNLIPVPHGGPESLPVDVQLSMGKGVYLDDYDAIFALRCVADFMDISEDCADILWPDWRPMKDALALTFSKGFCLLIDHDDAPPEMKIVDQDILPVSVFIGYVPKEFKPGCTIMFRGEELLIIDYDSLSSIEVKKSIASLFYLSFKQMFCDEVPIRYLKHTGSDRVGVAKALLEMECRVLKDAYDSQDNDKLELFLEIRKLRRSILSRDEIIYEMALEGNEGLAWYIMIKALKLVEGRMADDDKHRYQEPDDHSSRQLIETSLADGIAPVTEGALLCLFLDGFESEWKTELIKRNLVLDSLTADILRRNR